jgi:hypothetical protein
VVTIRERNSTKQIREVKVDTIVNYPVFLKNPILDEFKKMNLNQ